MRANSSLHHPSRPTPNAPELVAGGLRGNGEIPTLCARHDDTNWPAFLPPEKIQPRGAGLCLVLPRILGGSVSQGARRTLAIEFKAEFRVLKVARRNIRSGYISRQIRAGRESRSRRSKAWMEYANSWQMAPERPTQ